MSRIGMREQVAQAIADLRLATDTLQGVDRLCQDEKSDVEQQVRLLGLARSRVEEALSNIDHALETAKLKTT
jgi:hypothetical protein